MAFKRIFYGVTCGLLAVLITVGLALATVKFWVLPNIHQWKQPIAEVLSDYFGGHVEIGRLQVHWRAIQPEIELREVSFYDKNGQPALIVPYAYGRLKLNSLWTWRPNFERLEVEGLSITAQRTVAGEIEVLGQAFDISAPEVENNEAYGLLVAWLRQQGVLHVSHSHLSWVDLQQGNEALDVDLEMLRFSLQDQQLQVQGVVSSRRLAHAQVAFDSQWNLDDSLGTATPSLYPGPQGSIELRATGFQPSIWRRWVDLPSFLYQGRIDAQLRLLIQADELHHAEGALQIEHPFWADAQQFMSQEPQPFVHARQAEFHFELKKSALDYLAALNARSPMPTYVPGARWAIYAQDLSLHIPQELPEPLFFPQLAVQFHSALQDDQEVWYIEQLDLDSGAGRMQIKGELALNANDLLSSRVVLQGKAEQVALPSIYRYFPLSLDPELRQWFEEGLLAGTISTLDFDWQGAIQDFDYYQNFSSDYFRLEAELSAMAIDYYQADDDELGWPLLTGLDATLHWHNNALLVEVQHPARLQISAEHIVQVTALQAQIEDLYQQADLTVQVITSGDASNYQALWKHSNLGALLAGIAPVQEAMGRWQVPIALGVPLGVPLPDMEEQLWVQGQIEFGSNSSVQLWPTLAPLEKLQGTLYFSESGIRLSEVAGHWLGGAVQLEGALGQAEQVLTVTGHIQAEALQEFYSWPALGVLQGSLPATAQISVDTQKRTRIELQSTLEGVKVNLPAPLAKQQVSQAWPIYFYWQELDDEGRQDLLHFEIEQRLAGRVVFDKHTHRIVSAQLQSAGQAPVSLPRDEATAESLLLDVEQPELDLDAWWHWIAQWGNSVDKVWTWPEQVRLRLQAQRAQVLGSSLNYFTYTQQKERPEQWRVDISSDQIAGTAIWHQQSSVQHPRGVVEARFNRFDPYTTAGSDAPERALSEGKGAKEEILQQRISTPEAVKGAALKERVAAAKADTENTVVLRLTPSVAGTLPIHEVPVEQVAEARVPPLPFLPDITLEIESFKVHGYKLGQLQLEAQGLADASGWRIERFLVGANDQMSTEGQGQWRLWGADPALELAWQTNFEDFGAYAHYAGLAGLVQGGSGQATADFRWPLLPWEADLAQLQGEVVLQLVQGRLEPIRSRSAKMLELLSLQSLSRLARLDLDVAGLMQEGFPFDRIEGSVQFADAWVTTQDYQVVSPVGTLLFEGSTNMLTEAIDAQLLVIPEIDVSGAALAAVVAVNPVLGFGALIAQWLLKNPMAEAMTVRYQLQGSWDDYEVEEVPLARGTAQ